MRTLPFLLLSICIALWHPSLTQANSLYFDGINNHVDFGDVLDLGNTFTLEAWVLLEPGAVGAFPNWDVDIIAKVGGGGDIDLQKMIWNFSQPKSPIFKGLEILKANGNIYRTQNLAGMARWGTDLAREHGISRIGVTSSGIR